MHQIKYNGGGQGISRVANIFPYTIYSKRRRAMALINAFRQTHTHPPTQLQTLTDEQLQDMDNDYQNDWLQLYNGVIGFADIRDDLHDLLANVYDVGITHAENMQNEYERRNNQDQRINYNIRWLQLTIANMRRNRRRSRDIATYERALEDVLTLQRNRQQAHFPVNQRSTSHLADIISDMSQYTTDAEQGQYKPGITPEDQRKLSYDSLWQKVQELLQDPSLSAGQRDELTEFEQIILTKMGNEPKKREIVKELQERLNRILRQMKNMNRDMGFSPPPPPPQSPHDNSDTNGGNIRKNKPNKYNTNKYHLKRHRNKSHKKRTPRRNRMKSRKNL